MPHKTALQTLPKSLVAYNTVKEHENETETEKKKIEEKIDT